MKQPSAFLSFGHGGSDPGAVALELKEKDINLQIGLSCREELVRHGVHVVCSRVTDENDPVGQEVKEANAAGCDIAVSYHTNAGRGDGSETFCNLNNPDGKRLAELLEKHTQSLGQNSRGVKDGMHLYYIRKTNATAALSECAFIDNDVDNDIIDTLEEQRAFGVAYAKAILEYFDIAYVEKDAAKEVFPDTYTLKEFITDVQNATGSNPDSVAGPETIGNTVTVSRTENRYHEVVTALERRLKALGFYDGEIEADAGKTPIFGKGMEEAVNEYQKQVLGYREPDGEITAEKKMWKSLLGMI